MSNVRFTPEQSELFAAASHDRNPLHLSPEYARKTPYGQPVVFGILGALACFGRVRPKPGCFLSGITLEFLQPMFVDIDYELVISEASDQTTNIQLYDGSTLLLRATLVFAAGSTIEPSWKNQEPTVRSVPADLSPREL